MKKIMIILCNIILCVYILMLIDTNNIMNIARNNMKVCIHTTYDKSDNTLFSNHMCRFSDKNKDKSKNTDIFLIRIFTLHNFKDGYIWVVYSKEAKDINGNVISGSWHVNSLWKIHKEKGNWKIVNIIEDV